jgi:hypothetical protein
LYLLQNVGEGGYVVVTEIDDEGSFSRLLEKVMLISPRSMTKVPSPDCWRKCDVAEVDDEGSFSILLEKVMLMSPSERS